LPPKLSTRKSLHTKRIHLAPAWRPNVCSMKNIYNGVARMDANGEAVIQMPEWFSTTLEIYTLPVPGHQRTAVENLAQMVTNGDESEKRLEALPPATQQIQ